MPLKSIRKLFFITILLIIAVFGSSFYFFTSKAVGTSQPLKTNGPKTKDSIALLVMSSHLNFADNIKSSDFTDLLKNKRLYCTKDIAEDCKQVFNLTELPAVLQIADFNHSNDSIFLITSLDSVNHQFKVLTVDTLSYFKSPETYKFFTLTSHPFNFNSDVTHYVHTGVTALTRSTGIVLDRMGIDFYLENIKDYFKESELTHISNEVSMQDQCDYASMRMSFATKTAHFDIIKRLRANIIELTGNHNLDVGKEAYLNSLKWYEANKMPYFGGGKSPEEANRPLILTLKDSSRIAWIGFNELCPCGECADKQLGANRYSAEKAKTLIDSLKNKAKISYIIASVQFGEVDAYAPTTTQKNICKYLIDCGADVVMGSQAHQAQEIATYKDKIIFFGLGNFLFDQIHRIGVRQAFFLNCYFYKGKIIQYQPVYTFMNEQRQPTIAKEAEKKEIQKSILKRYNFPLR
jgi:poly-gamma-glutamate capsule biosynthesis protein CapA/YwtB (metallophosphatase superfamily)